MRRRTFLSLGLGLAAVGSGGAQAADEAQPGKPGKPIRALLVLGGCCHDYNKQKDLLTRGLSARAPLAWTVAYDPDITTGHLNPVYENPDWARGFDVVFHDECAADVKDLAVIDRILKPHRDGVPAVVLHCGMHSYRSAGFPTAVTPWFAFTGLQTTGHGPQLPIAVSFTDKQHPITKGMADWTTVNEELYNNSTGKLLETAHPLATGKQLIRDKEGKESVAEAIVAWTNSYVGPKDQRTRVFATTLGHNNETVGDPRYLDLLARGMLWALGR